MKFSIREPEFYKHLFQKNVEGQTESELQNLMLLLEIQKKRTKMISYFCTPKFKYIQKDSNS